MCQKCPSDLCAVLQYTPKYQNFNGYDAEGYFGLKKIVLTYYEKKLF